jgi:hypothetical protein
MLKFTSLVLALALSLPFLQAQTEWKLEKNQQGVKVETRKLKGWGLKEFRGVVQIRTSIAEFEKTLRDAPNRPKWMHNTVKTKDLEGSTNKEVFAYSVIEAPWPATNRDNVTKMSFKKSTDKELYVDLLGVPKHIPENKGIIRVEKTEGYWKGVDIGGGLIEITHQAVGTAGGSVPDWLANASVVDNPFYTLLNLKKYLEKK